MQTRLAPPGYTGGVSAVDHGLEVVEAMARGETDVSAGGGSEAMRAQILQDPQAFECGVI